MKKELQAITSQSLDLSFDLEIVEFQNRYMEIKINKVFRSIEYNNNYFWWFMEDLIFFLDKNKYQKRWDYEVIKILNLEVLKLSVEDLKDFKNKFKEVSNFDLIY